MKGLLYNLDGGDAEQKRSSYRCSKLIVTALLLIVFVIDSTAGVSVIHEEKIAEEQNNQSDIVLKINSFLGTVDKKGITITVHHYDGSELSATETSKWNRNILLSMATFQIQEADYPNGGGMVEEKYARSNAMGIKKTLVDRIVATFDGERLIVKVHRVDGNELSITNASDLRLKLIANEIVERIVDVMNYFGIESEEGWWEDDRISRWKPDDGVVVEFDQRIRYQFETDEASEHDLSLL